MTNHFDQAAQNWDNNPVNLERSQAIATEFLKLIPINQGMRALEFGSGTALLSFVLKEHFKEIVLMDSSIEMTRQAINKIEASGAAHLIPLHFDLEKNEYRDGSFDVIYTQMALHHVKDVEAMLLKFYTLLNPGGYVAIADLYAEDGSFHDKNFDGHLGFDPDYMKDVLIKTGFSNPVLTPCFEIKRIDSNHEEKLFPIFLVIAVKD